MVTFAHEVLDVLLVLGRRDQRSRPKLPGFAPRLEALVVRGLLRRGELLLLFTNMSNLIGFNRIKSD